MPSSLYKICYNQNSKTYQHKTNIYTYMYEGDADNKSVHSETDTCYDIPCQT